MTQEKSSGTMLLIDLLTYFIALMEQNH